MGRFAMADQVNHKGVKELLGQSPPLSKSNQTSNMSRGCCLCRAAQNLLAYNSASERQFTVMPTPNSFSSNGHKGILTGGNKVPRTTSLISILTKGNYVL